METIPFGKYKGKPMEVLAGDPAYCEWIQSTPGVADRFPQVVNFIVNNFGEPAETPEHNEFQARLLDPGFRSALVTTAWPMLKVLKSAVIFESSGFDALVTFGYEKEVEDVYESTVGIELKPVIGDEYPAVLRQVRSAQERNNAVINSERIGWRTKPFIKNGIVLYRDFQARVPVEDVRQIFRPFGFVSEAQVLENVV